MHTQPVVFENLIVDKFAWIADFPLVIIPFVIVGISGFILFLGMFTEKIREFLFKAFHIYGLTKRIAVHVKNITDQVMERLENNWNKNM